MSKSNKTESINSITHNMIEKILDKARQLAEADGYDYFPHALFNSEDMAYIEKAIETEEVA